MQRTLKYTFFITALVLVTLYPCSFSKTKKIESLAQKLETSLNERNKTEFFKLVSKDIANNIEERYNNFLNTFPNAKWEIKPSKRLKNNREVIEVIVTGQKELGNHTYTLTSNQKLAIDVDDGKIIKQEVLADYSILNSNKEKLDVTIAIPDIVLTGSNYDIDLILEKPLKAKVIAGGLIALNAKSNNMYPIKGMQLSLMSSGGLFKSARAPFQPGIQRWGALIAHPQGIISITKSIKVVSKSSDLIN